MTVVGLHHVQLAMPPGEETSATDFYERILGIPRVIKPPHLETRGGCWFETETVRVHLGVEKDFRPAEKAHPGFVVENLKSMKQHLLDAGVEVVDDQPLPGYDRFYTSDPFGNRTALTGGLTVGRVVFVRHALPVVDDAVPSGRWPLTDDGHLAAQQLGSRLQRPADKLVVASEELKARQTAEALSDQIVVDPRLNEVRRPWTDDGYQQLAEPGCKATSWKSGSRSVQQSTVWKTRSMRRSREATAQLVSSPTA